MHAGNTLVEQDVRLAEIRTKRLTHECTASESRFYESAEYQQGTEECR